MEHEMVCRGCLGVERKFVYMHEYGAAQAYESLLGIQVSTSDGFPQQLCSFCVRSLHRFAEFRARCLKAVELLAQARNEGRVVTKEYAISITSTYPELTPQYTSTQTVTLELLTPGLKQEDDTLHFVDLPNTLQVEKEEIISDNEINDVPDASETKNESEDLKLEPCEVFVNDFSELFKEKTKKRIKNENKRERKKKRVVNKVKKRNSKSNCNKTDKQIVTDYAKSAGFDIKFLSHEEQIKEVQEKLTENVASGHNCERCGKHFDAKKALERHTKYYHTPTSGSFTCDICTCIFSNKRTLRSHMTSHGWIFTCQACNFRTKQRTVLRKHQNFHEGKRFSCKYCGMEFSKTTSYFSHVRLKHASELSWCDLCGEFFISEKGVVNHKKLTHNVLEEFPRVCEKCDMRFKSETALQRHLDVEGCKSPSCVQCGDSFPDSHLLKYHLVQRHFADAAPENHDCAGCRTRFYTECGKQFTSSAYFKKHYSLVHGGAGRPRGRPGADPNALQSHRKYPRVPTAIRKWRVVGERGLVMERDEPPARRDKMAAMCERCGKECKNATELRVHQVRFHTAQSLFSCAHCSKGFKQKAQLQMHERVHTGERPYKCPDCPKAFKTYQAYSRHYLIHSGLRTHVCQLCEKCFQTSTATKMHIKTVHMKMAAPPRVRNRKH